MSQITCTNDYRQAILEVSYELYAVQLSDGGWSIADGPGLSLCEPDEKDLAGYHLPVRFESKDAAESAIISGPHSWFDIAVDSDWSKHAIASGGVFQEAYLIPPIEDL